MAADLKQVACQEIDRLADELNDLSQKIWVRPELAFEEHHAHQVLTDYLESRGFQVERRYKMDTAFRATWPGDTTPAGLPHVAVLCEYDALPEIGHACGHNLIAEVGVAAGLGVKAAMQAAGSPLGKLTVLGTPAEEGGGGKVKLIDAGVFGDVDVALMAHPTPFHDTRPAALAFMGPAEEGGGGKVKLIEQKVFQDVDFALMVHPAPFFDTRPIMLARLEVVVTYRGKASHASGFPWEGINALDAAVMCYQSVSNMRQQFKPTWRVHGIISKGGTKPNIIPDHTELVFYLRAPTDTELWVLRDKIFKCFDAAAAATGCTVEIALEEPMYSSLLTNSTLADLYDANAAALGVNMEDTFGGKSVGSTDMGNVSQVVPSIHPMFNIHTTALNHQREFTEAAGKPEAQPYTLAQGKALAMTAIDVMTSPELMAKVKAYFKKDKQQA